MKEHIIAMIENPRKFIEIALNNPTNAIIFLNPLPDTNLIEEDINNLVSFFHTLEKNHNCSSSEDIFCLVILAANLMVYFYKTDLICSLIDTQEGYFMEKLDKYYSILEENDFLNAVQKRRLECFMGYVQDTVKYFEAAIRHYTQAITLEKSYLVTPTNYKNLKEYSFQLSYTYLNAGHGAYGRPALTVAENYYKESINTATQVFKLPIDIERNELWYCIAKATQGIANIKYKTTKFAIAINLYIEAISTCQKGLGEQNNAAQQQLFLSVIRKSSLAIKYLLTKKHLVATEEQKKLLEDNISFLKDYLINAPQVSELIKLIKIITEAEDKLFFRPIIPYASFWARNNLQNNGCVTVDLVENPLDIIDCNRTS